LLTLFGERGGQAANKSQKSGRDDAVLLLEKYAAARSFGGPPLSSKALEGVTMKNAALLIGFLLIANVAHAGEPWKLIHSQGVMNFVHIDASSWKDQDQYRLAIGKICAGKQICQVLFWKDEKLVPRKLPMTDQQVNAQVAHWQYNGNTGLRRLLWSCEIVNEAGCL